MTHNQNTHTSVLLQEAVAALQIKATGTYVDGTYGRGGHTAALLAHLGNDGRVVAIDKDPAAVAHACEHYRHEARFFMWQGSFRDFPIALAQTGNSGKIQGLLLDLGVSSPQLDDAERGFSFMREGPLDMRMDPCQGESAAQWLAHASETEIAEVLWRYGEERFARLIARRIVGSRLQNPLQTTTQLAGLIEDVVRKREPGKHPATRSFQAIRIKVNQELDDVEACLRQAVDCLVPGGRLVVISFHSLEDRIVKHFLREVSSPPPVPRRLPVMYQAIQPPMRVIGKSVRASNEEVAANPRARSAIMRVAERLP